jgi:hypothetical protein
MVLLISSYGFSFRYQYKVLLPHIRRLIVGVLFITSSCG